MRPLRRDADSAVELGRGLFGARAAGPGDVAGWRRLPKQASRARQARGGGGGS